MENWHLTKDKLVERSIEFMTFKDFTSMEESRDNAFQSPLKGHVGNWILTIDKPQKGFPFPQLARFKIFINYFQDAMIGNILTCCFGK